jgi:hypothetical protein
LAGCSTHSSDAAAANLKNLNLGVVEISDGIPSRHDLGDGKICIITPTIQKDGSVVLDARFEESGKLLAPRPRVQTVSGRPASFFDGNICFELTPHIKGSAIHFEERQACASYTHIPSLSAEQGYYLVCKVNDMLGRIAISDAAAYRSYKTIESKAGQDIPFALWPAEVRQLHPVAVYDYDKNIVIVMWKNAHEEEGYYVVNVGQHLHSSQFPDPHEFPHDPGWNFKPIENHDAGYLYEYHWKKR